MGFVSRPRFGFIALNSRAERVGKRRYVAVLRGGRAAEGSGLGAALLDPNPAGTASTSRRGAGPPGSPRAPAGARTGRVLFVPGAGKQKMLGQKGTRSAPAPPGVGSGGATSAQAKWVPQSIAGLVGIPRLGWGALGRSWGARGLPAPPADRRKGRGAGGGGSVFCSPLATALF